MRGEGRDKTCRKGAEMLLKQFRQRKTVAPPTVSHYDTGIMQHCAMIKGSVVE